MSSGSAGKSVSSSFGVASSFFYPGSQCRSANPKSPLNASHAGAFMVCCQNLLFLRLCVTSLRFQHASFAAVFAPILLAAASIMPIFHDVLAPACSTSVDNQFCNHVPTILLITSIWPLPLFLYLTRGVFEHINLRVMSFAAESKWIKAKKRLFNGPTGIQIWNFLQNYEFNLVLKRVLRSKQRSFSKKLNF